MNMTEMIIKKRNGGELNKDEIHWFIKNYVDGVIPDYQVSALLMAIYFKGLNNKETYTLTREMENSGDHADLSSIKGIKVDKHSTGGVGDKTTLIVGPIVAALGAPVAKMSGRALGFTGGTIDKMEAMDGFKTSLGPDEFVEQVNEIGIAVIGQSGELTPADKKLYALRDVTGTVDNFSLIASSIMSKKLAAGSDAIVLDVTCGNGAFMSNEEDAEILAQMMVNIGKRAGREMMALITDMNEPLGHAVGNSLEIEEVIETLKGNGPEDLIEVCLNLAGAMLYLGAKADTLEEGKKLAKETLDSGKALAKFKELVEKQGGNPKIIDDYSLLPKAKFTKDLTANRRGYIESFDTSGVGFASQFSGAGRETKEDDIDMGAGIYLYAKLGDYVEEGEKIATVHSSEEGKLNSALEKLAQSIKIGEKPEMPKLIKKIIE
ncbi:MAG: pyrimidine-nucleoside phosphorylase [Clostridia bacterium]|nr:pyrimidine-nucleoside phosphorylase [Clostridia bacterium]